MCVVDVAPRHWTRADVTTLEDLAAIAAAEVAQRTAERRALATAADVRERAEAVLASIGDAFYLLDREWRFIEVNAAAEPLLQTTRAALLGRTLWEAFPDVAGSVFEGPYREAMSAGRITSVEAYFAPLGTWFDVRTYPWPGGLMVHFRDVGPQKAAEAERDRLIDALGLERARLASVFQQSPSFLAVLRGPDNVFDFVNDAYEQIVGHGRNIVGRPLFEALPETRGQGFDDYLGRVRATGEPLVFRDLPVQLERATGAPLEERFIDITYLPLVEPDGSREAVIAHGTDVTEQVRARKTVERLLAESEHARAQAEESERRFRSTADAAPVLIWTAGVDGLVDWFNQRWLDFTGRTMAAEIGTGWVDGVHPDDRERCLGSYRTNVTARRPFTMEYRLRRHDGEYRWLLDTGAPRVGPDGAVVGFVGSCADVSDQRVAVEALEAVNAQLEEQQIELELTNQQLQEQTAELEMQAEELQATANALEVRTNEADAARLTAEEARAAADAANLAKSQFLANMSHELRTPLNAIGGYVQLLELGLHGPVTDDQRGALGRVQKAQHRLLALINDVLNYAKLEGGRVEYDVQVVDLRDVVADVVPLIEPQIAAKGLAFDIELTAAPCAVWADREKLGQILVNLLSNAIKFTEPRDATTGAPGRVAVRLAARSETTDAVFLRVTDTGRGIPRDKQDAIFEPFVQVRTGYAQATEGTGLGLAISRDLARGMGGDLRVRSVEGEGAVFTVALRRAADDGATEGTGHG